MPTVDRFAPLRHADYRRLLTSLLAMTVAAEVQGTVVGWQVYAITGDPLALGLIGLAEAAPFIGAALFAGHVADIADRRQVAIRATALLLATSLALLALTVTGEIAAHLWLVYLLAGLSGIARSFAGPARTALAADLVPRALDAPAVGLRTAVWQIGAVGGPALGGACFAVGGPALGYAVDAGLTLVAIATMLRIRHRREPVAASEGVWTSLRDGVRFVVAQRVLFGAMALDLFAVLFGGAVALLPVFARDILHVGPSGLGVLRAAPAAGALAMAAVLAYRPVFTRAGPTMLGAVAVFGLAIIGFGLSTAPWLSVALLALSGAADYVSVVVRSTAMQVFTPDRLRGRVAAVNAVFIGSSNELGAFESGVAARLLGTVPSVVAGGTVTLLVVAVTAWRVPALRRLRRIES